MRKRKRRSTNEATPRAPRGVEAVEPVELGTAGFLAMTLGGLLLTSAAVGVLQLAADGAVGFWVEVLACVATAFVWWPLVDVAWQWLNRTPGARRTGRRRTIGTVFVAGGVGPLALLVAGAATGSDALSWAAGVVLVLVCVVRTVR